MDRTIYWIDAWVIALAFALSMTVAWYLGWRWGHRLKPEPGEDPAIKFTDASMALLGLLLAFTFSMAMVRHDQRRQAVVAESNAIADFYTCASLLKQPHRSALQDLIHHYTRNQLAMMEQVLPDQAEAELIGRNRQDHAEMTKAVDQALDGRPLDLALANTLNNLTSSNAARLAAYDEILPWSIVALLFLSSIVPSFLMGIRQGEMHKLQRAGALSFIALVSLVIFVTLDLNQPRRGLIWVNRQPMERVLTSMEG